MYVPPIIKLYFLNWPFQYQSSLRTSKFEPNSLISLNSLSYVKVPHDEQIFYLETNTLNIKFTFFNKSKTSLYCINNLYSGPKSYSWGFK